jgi:hypothetical protein
MHKKNLHPAAPDFQKKEKRKKKEVGLARSWVSPLGLVGSRRWVSLAVGLANPRFVFFFLFFVFSAVGLVDPRFVCLFFFVFSAVGLATSPRRRSEPRHLAATHLATSRRPATETHGWVSLAVGLVFLGFRMIKSKKWLTFPSRF